jgi:sugar lactone lactonase YvrE
MQRIHALLVLLLLTAPSAFAAATPLQHGDVLVGGDHPGSLISPFPYPIDLVRGAAPLPSGRVGEPNGLAFGGDGRLYFTQSNALQYLGAFDASGNGTPFAGDGGLDDASGVTVNRAGTFYVAATVGMRLLEIAANGSIVRTASLGIADPLVALDLAADQCTLYAAPLAGGTIHRFDVCSWNAVPDLSAAIVAGGGLRVDRDGSILASSGNAILRFSPAGAQLQTYLFTGLGHFGPLALSADDSTVWATAGANGSTTASSLFRLDLGAQSVVAGPFPLFLNTDAHAIAVVDEPRAGILPAVPPAAVPAIGTIGLILLLTALIGIACLRS